MCLCGIPALNLTDDDRLCLLTLALALDKTPSPTLCVALALYGQ